MALKLCPRKQLRILWHNHRGGEFIKKAKKKWQLKSVVLSGATWSFITVDAFNGVQMEVWALFTPLFTHDDFSASLSRAALRCYTDKEIHLRQRYALLLSRKFHITVLQFNLRNGLGYKINWEKLSPLFREKHRTVKVVQIWGALPVEHNRRSGGI